MPTAQRPIMRAVVEVENGRVAVTDVTTRLAQVSKCIIKYFPAVSTS